MLAVGIALFSFSACTDANAQTGRSAQSEGWEYKALTFDVFREGEVLLCGGGALLADRLNVLGAEGWQLISVARQQHELPFFIFKRRLP